MKSRLKLHVNKALSSLILVACSGVVSVFSYSGEASASITKAGVTLEDTVSYEGKTLKLNGAGIRDKFFMDIYVGALYLENYATSAESLMNSKETKLMQLHFVYKKVEVEKIRDSWKDGYKNSCVKLEKKDNAATCAFHGELEKINSMMVDMTKGQVLAFGFTADTVSVYVQNQKKGEVKKEGFPAAVMGIFLENSDLKGLKKGVLSGGK